MYGGAWCPKNMVSKESYEYLQIDLGELTVVTKVEVQGRFGNGQVRKMYNSYGTGVLDTKCRFELIFCGS